MSPHLSTTSRLEVDRPSRGSGSRAPEAGQPAYDPSGDPKGTGRGIAVVGENRQARSAANALEVRSRTGTPGTSPTQRLRSAKAVALASENRCRNSALETSLIGTPVVLSYAASRLRISATAIPPELGTGIP